MPVSATHDSQDRRGLAVGFSLPHKFQPPRIVHGVERHAAQRASLVQSKGAPHSRGFAM